MGDIRATKMAVEGEKVLELINELINQITKYEIELRETKDKSDEAKAEAAEVYGRLTKALQQLLATVKDAQIQTQDFLLHVKKGDKDGVFDGIKRDKKGRKLPTGKEDKGDSGVFSADSKTIEPKESRRIGMNLEDAFDSEEQTDASLGTSCATSSTGSLISQCTNDLEQTDLSDASEQTYQPADHSSPPNISPEPSEDSIEDNSAYH